MTEKLDLFAAAPSLMKEWMRTSRAVNASLEPALVELAYDFFTMPLSERTEELAPFVLSVNEFLVPPRATRTVGTTCSTFGTGFTEVPRTWRTPSAIPFMPWM